MLIGRNTGTKMLSDGNSIRTFGFAENLNDNPAVPGPTIEVNEGDSVVIDFWNVSQGAPHTIHLHGLDVDQQNDGVPHLSFEVHHMEHGYYRFKAPHAGTYLYHCHVVSSIHVQAGMYGLLVVRPPDGSNHTWDGGYEIHSEAWLFMSEIDTMWHQDSVLLHEYDTSMTHHMVPIPVYDPQHFLVNGLGDQQLIGEVSVTGLANSNIYVRLANIGFCGNRVIFPPGLNARIIDSDGRPLPQEESSDTVYLYPGERYGVLCQPTTEFQEVVTVQYLSMNTLQVAGEQEIAVDISGFLGLEDHPANAFHVFPNPARDEIVISAAKGQWDDVVEARITSMNGTTIKRIAFKGTASGTRTIPIADMNPGLYMITVVTADMTCQQRFIKL